MLERGIEPGQPGIVTSGTGSGKTESFMLPILAAMSNEAVNWPKPASNYLSNSVVGFVTWKVEPSACWGEPAGGVACAGPLSDERAGRGSDGAPAPDARLR